MAKKVKGAKGPKLPEKVAKKSTRPKATPRKYGRS